MQHGCNIWPIASPGGFELSLDLGTKVPSFRLAVILMKRLNLCFRLAATSGLRVN